MKITKFDVSNISEENIDLALSLHGQYGNQISEIIRVESVVGIENKYKSEIISEQQVIQRYLVEYFSAREDTSKNSVSTMTEILRRKELKDNQVDADGNKIEVERVHIGLNFIHEQFNNNNLFPIATFMSLVANSGVGKSDYLYIMANKLLMQDYNVLLCSYEFGEDRLALLADSAERNGKDRMREARLANKFDNLFVNYYSRDLDSLELMIDIAHTNGTRAVLIDSFGEIERTESEYILQQKLSMMLNKKANDYGMFIAIIAQTRAQEDDGQYTVRGGTDLIYKPDLSIHIKKLFAEDQSGRRIVHLLKNRESDNNGKTIITSYNAETRQPVFEMDYLGLDEKGEPLKELKFIKRKGSFGK